MSIENPGDGVRCDRCDRTPHEVPETPDWLLASEHGHGFMHVYQEVICYACHNAQQDEIEARFSLGNAVRVGKGLQYPHTIDISVTDNTMWVDGQRVRNYAPVPQIELVRPGQWAKQDRPRRRR